MGETIYTLLIAIVTVLGSASAWKYYDKRADEKKEEDNYQKWECKERIEKLELLLEKSSEEKDDLRTKILQLTKQVAELTMKVKYLESENHKQLSELITKK